MPIADQHMKWDGRLGQPPHAHSDHPLAAWTHFPTWGEIWLSAFRAVGNVRGACQLAQIPRQTYYRYLHNCEEFRTAVAHAQDDMIDSIEQVVITMALQDKNLKAALALLRAYRPERWGPVAQQAAAAAPPAIDHANLRDRLRIKAGLPALPGAATPPAGPPLIGEILDDRDPLADDDSPD